jgi:hypothetical protein
MLKHQNKFSPIVSKVTFLKHVYEIENYSSFTAEMNIEISQANIEVDDTCLVAFLGKTERKAGCCCGFALQEKVSSYSISRMSSRSNTHHSTLS